MTENHGLAAHQQDTAIMAMELTQKHIGARVRFRYPSHPTVGIQQVIEGKLASYTMTKAGVDVYLDGGDVGLSIPKLALTDSIHVEPDRDLLYTLGLK